MERPGKFRSIDLDRSHVPAPDRLCDAGGCNDRGVDLKGHGNLVADTFIDGRRADVKRLFVGLCNRTALQNHENDEKEETGNAFPGFERIHGDPPLSAVEQSYVDSDRTLAHPNSFF